MLFGEGWHLAWNSFADDSGDAGIADAQPDEIRSVSVFAVTPGVIAVAVRAALSKEVPPLLE
jgi:hypothetical protein